MPIFIPIEDTRSIPEFNDLPLPITGDEYIIVNRQPDGDYKVTAQDMKEWVISNIDVVAPQSFKVIDSTSDDYVLSLPDFQNGDDYFDVLYLRMNNSINNTVSVSTALTSLDQGVQITIRQVGNGTTSILPLSGVTINGNLTFADPDDTKTLIKVGANEWDVVGAVLFEENFVRTNIDQNLNNSQKFTAMKNIGALKNYQYVLVSNESEYIIPNTICEDGVDFYDIVYIGSDNASSHLISVTDVLSDLPVGFQITIRQVGTGIITINAGVGVTLTGNPIFFGQGDTKTIVKISVNNDWDIVGAQLIDLSPFEQIVNKTTNFNTINHLLYPTVQAVQEYVDDLVLLDDSNNVKVTAQTFNDSQKYQALTNIGALKNYNYIEDATTLHELQLSDFKSSVDYYDTVYIKMMNTGDNVVRFMPELSPLAIGTQITIRQGGNGQTFIEAANTVIVNGNLEFNGIDDTKTVIKIGANEWDAIGARYLDMSAFETSNNKAYDFNVVNHTLYPSVQAVKAQLDLKADASDTQDALDLKLDIADYNNYYRGTYLTYSALATAVPTGQPGDYAIVDTGVGNDAVTYIWDDNDSQWVSGGSGGGPTTTDSLPEGSTNLYFTSGRAITSGATAFVRYDASQSLSGGQQAQAQSNLGLGDVVTHAYAEFELVANKATNLTSPNNTKYPTTLAVQNELDLKLDIADYNNYYRGTYSSTSALNIAVPTGNPGDYAIVDTGVGQDASTYIWDDNDSQWIIGSSTGGPTTTDSLPEGSTNLYFTTARAVTSGATAFVRYDEAQSLTGGQQTQARSNIGLGDVSTHSYSEFEVVTNKATSLASPDNTKYPTTLAVQNELDLKLDIADYNVYYRGTYTSSGNLTTAHPTANPGDYAIVDAGIGTDALIYIWDNTDNVWVSSSSGGGGGPSTTDALTEGSTNLYFTNARAITAGATAFVRYDASQSLSGGQQTQARSNLGLGTMAVESTSTYQTVANTRYSFNNQTGTSYALVSSDITPSGKGLIVATNASAISITIGTPTGLSASVGDSVTIIQGGAGTVTVTGSGGATLSSTAVFGGINKAMTFVADTTTSWRVIGV